jgi:membrane protein implicated in regulation of membrane protease activity
MISMSWWLWVLAGLALLGAELLAPGGFFVFFFGSGNGTPPATAQSGRS